MAPRWVRYTRQARGRIQGVLVPDPPVLLHYGDDFDEGYRHDARLNLNPVRKYTPVVPQNWDLTAPGFDKPAPNPVNLLGPTFLGHEPVVTTNSAESFIAAFDKRSNSQPDVKDDIDAHITSGMISRILEHPMEFEPFDETPEMVDRWQSKFSSEKVKRMETAFLNLQHIALDDPYLAEKTLSVKIEALLKRNDPTWAPRLIYASTDEFNRLTGPCVHEVTKRLDKMLLRGLGPIKYMMGYGRQDTELASFIDDEDYPHVAEGDFSKNDLMQRRGVALVFDALLGKVGAPKWLRELFINHIQFSVKYNPLGLKAWLENQLPTGTTITTPRNTIWNASQFTHHCVKEGHHGKALVLGDDLLAILRKAINLALWSADTDECKMKLTGAAPALWGEATFLSRRFCFQGDVPCMMPKLFKALARFNCRANINGAVSDAKYMAGKALSYAYEFRHFPELRDMFMERYRMEGADGVPEVSEVSWFTRTSGVDLCDLERVILEEPVTVSDNALVEFMFDAYGLRSSPVTMLQVAASVIKSNLPLLLDLPTGADIDL